MFWFPVWRYSSVKIKENDWRDQLAANLIGSTPAGLAAVALGRAQGDTGRIHCPHRHCSGKDRFSSYPDL
jgi:hypothetical protein